MQFLRLYSLIASLGKAILHRFLMLKLPQAITLAAGWGGFSGIKNSPFEKIELPDEKLDHNTQLNGNSSSIRPTFSWHANGLEKFPAIVIADWDFLAIF